MAFPGPRRRDRRPGHATARGLSRGGATCYIRRVLRRLYFWVMRQADTPHATRTLALVSFLESSIFPIPPDALLIPMCLANRARAWRFAFVCTVASVLGGLAGYAIGFFLIETLGSFIARIYSLELDTFDAWYAEWGLWVILIKGLTPIPYKLVTIASGAAHFSLPIFLAASVVTRGIRFFAVAGLLRWKGEPIRIFVEKHLTWVTTIFVVGLVGGILAIRYI